MGQQRGTLGHVVRFTAIGLAVFHIWTGLFGIGYILEQAAVHVGVGMILIFLLVPIRKGSVSTGEIRWWDILFVAAAFAGASYTYFNWSHFMPLMKEGPNTAEMIMAVAMTLAILESGRRIIGWIFPSLTAAILVYAFWGQYVPGVFGHAPFKVESIFKMVYFSMNGIWGYLTSLSATYLALFVLFGAILLESGGGKTFTDLAIIAAGKFRGGPAKVAVLASGFFGMLTGSTMANVATTGSFTIPMMKRLGYRPEFAGGVEATASTGGQVAPPIMGIGAFVMAELLNIPYLTICIVAAVPALLFYVSCLMGVHFQAVKVGLKPMPPEDIPSPKAVLTYSNMSSLILPIGVLLYLLLNGYSLTLVGASACVAALVPYVFPSVSGSVIRERLRSLPNVLELAGKALAGIIPMIVCANIILGLLTGTGLSIKFSSLIMSLSGESLVLSLATAAILVLLLGCGLPTAAAYVLGVTVAGPMLVKLGVLPLAAHLFIFYYAILSNITPPICPAVFVAMGIARSKLTGTSAVAVSLAPILYLVPFVFVFDNTLLLMGSSTAVLLGVGTAVIGAVALAGSVRRQFVSACSVPETFALAASGILLLLSGWRTDLAGAALLAAIVLEQLWRTKKMSVEY
jgi:TRAP transporter 4TM/12TM fusion protein